MAISAGVTILAPEMQRDPRLVRDLDGRLHADERQERLRRFVDDWRSHLWEELERIDQNFSQGVRDVGDVTEDPVAILVQPHDEASILDLITTDNVPFNKLMTVLAHDCLEIFHCRQQVISSIYPRLVVFGLRTNWEEMPSEGELQKTFAHSFKFLQELLEVISKLRAVLSNLVQQLEAIYSSDASRSSNKLFASFWNVRLGTVVMSLAEGFAILVTIEELVAQNSSLGHAMSLFKRMLHSVRSNPPIYGMQSEQVDFLDVEVDRIDNTLMEGIFQRCIQEDFFGQAGMQKLKSNRRFLDEILQCVRSALVQILHRLDSPREYPDDRENAVGLLAVWVFHSWMAGETQTLNKRMIRAALEVHRRAPVMHLFCNVRLVTVNFLTAHLPPWTASTTVIKEAQRDTELITSNYLAALEEALDRQGQSLRRALANWLVSFNSTVSRVVQQLAVHAMLGTRFKQLAEGVFLGNRLRHILRSTMDLHSYLQVPINKEKLKKLRYIAETLKDVEGMFHRRSNETALGIGHMLQLAQTQIQRRLIPVKDQLEADLHAISKSSAVLMLARSITRSGKDMDAKLMDAMAAVKLALEMSQGRASKQRSVILRLTLDVVCSLQSRVSEEIAAEMLELCSLIEVVANIHDIVKSVTDCSFLYWSRETMPTCFSMLYGQPREARRLQFVINAFKDPIKLLKNGCAESLVIESYEREMEDAIQHELVGPLCRDIETDLRLHVHSAHLMGAVNPTRTGIRDSSWFLYLSPLKLASKKIHIKSRVESYLIAAFYDHTAVALHDWKTYEEMRQLAELKYWLELEDIHLPGQTLDQGVDVLGIMRNIHLFVACYTYNLNTQVFIEKPSNAFNRKYLNIVNARHVANSIRSHGTGIMSTTINFAYQFLAEKFVVFSQFLFDDHIKSRLMKEHRFYKESRLKGSMNYPVGRADKLNKDIQKLGLTDDGLSFLDQFRQLISEMGNALGFVRLVRLGGLHYCSSASGFVHNLSENKSFEEAAREAGITEIGVYAAKILDQALESQKMSTDRMDYFNILTSVFSQELQSNDNLHLRDFFLIFPALTFNAVEAMLQAKDRMVKRSRDSTGGMFTDDGFALGLAYVLKVLGQDQQFDSLHWFDSARDYFTAEKAKIADGLDMDSISSGMNGLQIWSQKLASISEEGAQNLQLVMKRIGSYSMELDLIYFTFSGARIFFQQ